MGCRVKKLMNMFIFFQFVSQMCLRYVKRSLYMEILHECLDYQGYNDCFLSLWVSLGVTEISYCLKYMESAHFHTKFLF